jgi:pyridoxal phosphate enzyme (YggS family)
MNKIAERIRAVHERVEQACCRAARAPGEVRIVVITKSAPIEAVKQVVDMGCTELGENRAQQLVKVSQQIEQFLADGNGSGRLPASVNWHMVGHLQRNKVRQVLGTCSMIHSVDTLRLAEEINSAAGRMRLRPKVLLQVNSSDEPQKYGVPVGAATHMAEQIETLPNLRLVGLMTMAPLTHDKGVIRACFERTRELFIEMRGERLVGPQFTELSMGMSNDYEIAAEQGATILRIGSAIFA